MDQIVIITGKHLEGIEPARFEIFDRLRKGVRAFRAAFHPQEGITDVLRIGWAAQSHKAPFDPAVAREALGSDRALLGWMQYPIFRPLFKIPILEMCHKERVAGEPVSVALDSIVPVEITHEADGFFVCQG